MKMNEKNCGQKLLTLIASAIFMLGCSIVVHAQDLQETTPGVGWRRLAPPTDLERTQNEDGYLALRWDAPLPLDNNGVGGYHVYRKKANEIGYTFLGFTENTSYIDVTAERLATYNYQVRCVVDKTGARPSDPVTLEDIIFGVTDPQNFKVVQVSKEASYTPQLQMLWTMERNRSYTVYVSDNKDFTNFITVENVVSGDYFAHDAIYNAGGNDSVNVYAKKLYFGLIAKDNLEASNRVIATQNFNFKALPIPKIYTATTDYIAPLTIHMTPPLSHPAAVTEYRHLKNENWTKFTGLTIRMQTYDFYARTMPQHANGVFGLPSKEAHEKYTYVEHQLEGIGTEVSPFLIRNYLDMWALSEFVKGGESYNNMFFKVVKDINMGGAKKPWYPVGSATSPFKGTFDGGEKTFKNLYIDDKQLPIQAFGLFGYVDSVKFSNIKIKDAVLNLSTLEGDSVAAGILVGNNVNGTYNNCEVSGQVFIRTEEPIRQAYVGGFAGYVPGSTFKDIKTDVKMSIVDQGQIEEGHYAGFVGDATGSSNYNTIVTRCEILREPTHHDIYIITGADEEISPDLFTMCWNVIPPSVKVPQTWGKFVSALTDPQIETLVKHCFSVKENKKIICPPEGTALIIEPFHHNGNSYYPSTIAPTEILMKTNKYGMITNHTFTSFNKITKKNIRIPTTYVASEVPFVIAEQTLYLTVQDFKFTANPFEVCQLPDPNAPITLRWTALPNFDYQLYVSDTPFTQGQVDSVRIPLTADDIYEGIFDFYPEDIFQKLYITAPKYFALAIHSDTVTQFLTTEAVSFNLPQFPEPIFNIANNETLYAPTKINVYQVSSEYEGRYTTDGSEPVITSPSFTDAIPVSTSGTLSVKFFPNKRSKYYESDIYQLTYTVESRQLAGDGSETSPYLIQSKKDLDWIADKTQNDEKFSGKHFNVTQNIDYEGAEFRPIRIFEGFIHGNKNTLKNIVVGNRANSMFGTLNAIDNWNIEYTLNTQQQKNVFISSVLAFTNQGPLEKVSLTGNLIIQDDVIFFGMISAITNQKIQDVYHDLTIDCAKLKKETSMIHGMGHLFTPLSTLNNPKLAVKFALKNNKKVAPTLTLFGVSDAQNNHFVNPEIYVIIPDGFENKIDFIQNNEATYIVDGKKFIRSPGQCFNFAKNAITHSNNINEKFTFLPDYYATYDSSLGYIATENTCAKVTPIESEWLIKDMPIPVRATFNIQVTPKADFIVNASPVSVGEYLSQSMLSMQPEIPGVISWLNPYVIVDAPGEYEWIFIPENKKKYSEVTGVAKVRIAQKELVVHNLELSTVWKDQPFQNIIVKGEATLPGGKVVPWADVKYSWNVDPTTIPVEGGIYDLLLSYENTGDGLSAATDNSNNYYETRVRLQLHTQVCDAPRLLKAKTSDAGVQLTWSAPKGYESIPLYYGIIREVNGVKEEQWMTEPDITSFTDLESLQYYGQKATYTIVAAGTVEIYGRGEPSNAITVSSGIAAPDLTATEVLNDSMSINLKVDIPQRNVYVRFYRALDRIDNDLVPISEWGLNRELQFTETYENAAHPCYYYAQASLDAKGKNKGTVSNYVKFTPMPNIPNRPVLTRSETSTITATWSPVFGAHSYQIEFKDQPGFPQTVKTTSYVFTAPQEKTEYVARVRAITATGAATAWSEYSLAGWTNSETTVASDFTFHKEETTPTTMVISWLPTENVPFYRVYDDQNIPVTDWITINGIERYRHTLPIKADTERGVIFNYHVVCASDEAQKQFYSKRSNTAEVWFKLNQMDLDPVTVLNDAYLTWDLDLAIGEPANSTRSYKIYVSKDAGGTDSKAISDWFSDTQFTDKKYKTYLNEGYRFYAMRASFRTMNQTDYDGVISAFTTPIPDVEIISTAPKFVKDSCYNNAQGVSLTWEDNGFPNATGYTIFAKPKDDKKAHYKFVARTSNLTYNDSYAERGVIYNYYVQASNQTAVSKLSKPYASYRKFPAPQIEAQIIEGETIPKPYAHISWAIPEEYPEASAHVCRWTQSTKDSSIVMNKKFKFLPAETTYYKDFTIIPGVTYYYTVEYKKTPKAKVFSDHSEFAETLLRIAPPIQLTASNDLVDAIKISWKKPKGANFFRILRNQNGALVTLKDKKGNEWQKGNSYTDKGVTGSALYLVQFANDAYGKNPGGIGEVIGTTRLPAPDLLFVSNGTLVDFIRVEWRNNTELSPEVLIEIQNKKTKEVIYSQRVNAKDLTCDIPVGQCIPGVTYNVYVSAWAPLDQVNGAPSLRSKAKDGAFKLTPPTQVAADHKMANTQINVRWNASFGATHYRLYRQCFDEENIVAVSPWIDDCSFCDNSIELMPHMNYRYFVRAAINAKGDAQSDYSPTDIGALIYQDVDFTPIAKGVLTNFSIRDNLITDMAYMPLTAKPSITAFYTDPFTLKNKKLAVSIRDYPKGKEVQVDSFLAFVTKDALIYNKKTFKSYLKADKDVNTFIKNEQKQIDMRVTMRGGNRDATYKKKEHNFNVILNPATAQIDSMYADSIRCDLLTTEPLAIYGQFLGTKKPKVYIQTAPGKLTSLKVTTGKTYRDFYMKSYVSDRDGYGVIFVDFPTKWKNATKIPAEIRDPNVQRYLVIDNGIGITAYPITIVYQAFEEE